ncbi:MAG: proprotein convertase P-domain-containing protein [Planctomycetota bacterium]
MEARRREQWSVAILLGVGAFCFPVFADQVYKYEGEFNLQIPAEQDTGKGWMADAVIQVSDPFTIYDLDVRISFTHESLFDLQIVLQSPAGTNVALSLADNLAFIVRGEDNRLTTVGGSGEWFFDDEAQVSIEEATKPFFGSFRPVSSLSLFDNEDAYGSWHLQIYDQWQAHTGTLDSFELTITIPEPATVVLLTLGTGCAALFRPRRRL